jgi:hypothetical protein
VKRRNAGAQLRSVRPIPTTADVLATASGQDAARPEELMVADGPYLAAYIRKDYLGRLRPKRLLRQEFDAWPDRAQFVRQRACGQVG